MHTENKEYVPSEKGELTGYKHYKVAPLEGKEMSCKCQVPKPEVTDANLSG